MLKTHRHICLIRKFYNVIQPATNRLSSLIADACLLSARKWGHLSKHGGSRLSYINSHYRPTSSLPIVVFTSAHGCFHYSEQNAWESFFLFVKLLTSGHRLGKAPLRSAQNCHVPFDRLFGDAREAIHLPLSLLRPPARKQRAASSCGPGSSILPGRFFWETLLLSPRAWGNILPRMSCLGPSAPSRPCCEPLENICISLHFSLLKMQPSPKGMWSPFLRRSCHGGRRSGPPSSACQNGVTQLNKTNIKTRHRLKMLSKMKRGGELGQKGG